MKLALTRDFLSTPQVAAALGVSVSTVKRWVEDGVLPAQKTAGGHRKFVLADVLELARRNNLPIRDPASIEIRGRTRQRDDNELAGELYRSLLEPESIGVRRLLIDRYRTGMPIENLADSLVAPAMHQIGEDWATGRIDVMHEHRATQHCLGALHEIKTLLEARALRNPPIAVGGAVEGDFSEIPTLLAQMVLLDNGWRAVNLGPNTPLASMNRALHEMRPRLVWISASHLADPEAFPRGYNPLFRQAEEAGAAIILGGNAFTEKVRTRLSYAAYGDRLSHLAAFARTLHPRPRRPRRGRPAQRNG